MAGHRGKRHSASRAHDPRTRVARLLIAGTVLAWVPILVRAYHSDHKSE